MNICFYTPSWPPGGVANGVVSYTKEMANSIQKLNHKVSVISRNINQTANIPRQISHYDIEKHSSTLDYYLSKAFDPQKKGHGKYFYETNKLNRALKYANMQTPIDVLEIEESYGWSKKISDKFDFLTTTRLHGPHFLMLDWSDSSNISINDKYRIEREREAILSAQLVTSPSLDVLRKTQEFYDLELKNAAVIPNPIQDTEKENFWSLDECDQNTLLFIGRFDRIKGGDIMLDAFNELSSRYPDLKLIFVGPDFNIEDKGELLDIHTYAANNLSKIAQKNLSYLGYQSPEKIQKLRKKSFITIICSRYENFGYNMLESMATGSPIVSTTSGGLSEMISNNNTAVAAQEVSGPAVAEAIEKLIFDKNLAKFIGNNARIECSKLYNSDTVAQTTVDTYKKTLGQTK